MKKKLLSTLFWMLIAIVLFWTIIKLSNSANESEIVLPSHLDAMMTWKVRQNLNYGSGLTMAENTRYNTWSRNNMMIDNMAEKLWMTQDEIQKNLDEGKTMRELMEEKWVNVENIKWSWANHEITWEQLRIKPWQTEIDVENISINNL